MGGEWVTSVRSASSIHLESLGAEANSRSRDRLVVRQLNRLTLKPINRRDRYMIWTLAPIHRWVNGVIGTTTPSSDGGDEGKAHPLGRSQVVDDVESSKWRDLRGGARSLQSHVIQVSSLIRCDRAIIERIISRLNLVLLFLVRPLCELTEQSSRAPRPALMNSCVYCSPVASN